jgi:hypothetical protein
VRVPELLVWKKVSRLTDISNAISKIGKTWSCNGLMSSESYNSGTGFGYERILRVVPHTRGWLFRMYHSVGILHHNYIHRNPLYTKYRDHQLAVHVLYLYSFLVFYSLFVFVLCLVSCCQFLWIVDSWLPIRFSLPFVYILLIIPFQNGRYDTTYDYHGGHTFKIFTLYYRKLLIKVQ